MTHLFMESQVFLRRDWERHIVPVVRPVLRHLKLFRPATIDLVAKQFAAG